MTRRQSLTEAEAAILRLCVLAHAFVPMGRSADKLAADGLLGEQFRDGKPRRVTEAGQEALREFEAEREREIRDRTLDAIFAGFVETLVDAGIDESKALAEAHSIRARAVEILGSWRKA